ncbi:hypothetical protein ACH42_02475 [Endozoicomonas sp. (ex Bugula neritina AB1)]|nr:hypothetical protein ACH42_02475 [Endozoicomonas sp. (ex Bugula neritina AB1)]
MFFVNSLVNGSRSLITEVVQSVRMVAVFACILPGLSVGADFSIPIYPSGELEVSEQKLQQNYPVITDLMKKVNGVVTSDGAQWMKGQLNRQLSLLSSGHSSESAYQFYVKAFKQLGVNELFSCQSYSCGASNYWANDVFDIARLYGLDRYQFYFIGEKKGEYFSVYTVKRGNGRTYALVDVFTPESNPLVENVTDTHIKIEDLYVQVPIDRSVKVKNLLGELQEQPSVSVVLQIQAVLPANMEQLDQQHVHLRQQVEQLQNHLVSNGIKAARIRINLAVVEGSSDLIDLPADTLWLRVFRLKN